MADANATAAAHAVLGDLGLGDEGAETPSSAVEAVAETPVQQETVEPVGPDPEDFEIPEDIRELLAEPNFEAETEAEIAAAAANEEEGEYEAEYDDDAVAKERKARIAAE